MGGLPGGRITWWEGLSVTLSVTVPEEAGVPGGLGQGGEEGRKGQGQGREAGPGLVVSKYGRRRWVGKLRRNLGFQHSGSGA